TEAEIATRRVNDNLEDALVNGLAGYTVAGNTGYGYTTHPNRNTFEFGNGAWTGADMGTNILTDVLDMITILHGDNYFGPYVLYVPTDYWVALLADFKTNSDKSIISRVMEIPDIQDIRALDTLTTNNIILVQMTADVVEEVVGFQPQLVQWEEQGGFKINFKVLAIMVPRLKSDYNGRMGLLHGSTASGGG
ncbi:MAG: major capsid protein, partial [Candidatus Thorarchaeota archaeon]